MGRIVYQFEVEHIFAQSLWNDTTFRTLLNNAGFSKEMRGNKIALYQNSEVVEALQNASDEFKASTLEGGFGLNRHEGAASGGSQYGKNTFLRAQLTMINDSGASDEAKKYALLHLHEWTTRLARGEILGSDGKPIPVMGNTDLGHTCCYAAHQ